MERSVEKADASDIPRKSKTLDSLSVSVGKSATASSRSRAKSGISSSTLQSKILKRKRSSPSGIGASSIEFRKKSGKEVSLNSFITGSGKSKVRLGVSGLKANGSFSGVGKREKQSSSSGAHRNSRSVSHNSHVVGNDFALPLSKEENHFFGDFCSANGLQSGIVISKRPRGILRRKKVVQPVNFGKEIVGSSRRKGSIDQLKGSLSASQSHSYRHKRKLIDPKYDDSTHRGKKNNCNVDPVKATKRSFQDRKGGTNFLDNKNFLLNAVGVFPGNDEDNLEQNAARMLSSRFDPSCSGFSHFSVGSPKLSKDSSFVLSQRSSNGSSVETNDKGRVLRPRNYNGRGFTRKRRHFYEVCSNNMDPYWVVKQRIRVFWPLDKCWYFGLVKDYDPATMMHHVKYDDRDEEWINLQNERFKLLLFPSELANKFNHERSIKEVKKKDMERQKGSMGDLSTGGLVETEPIISWLTRSTRRERQSALGIIKTQRRILSASKSFKTMGTSSIMSNSSSGLLDGSAEGENVGNRNCYESRKLPFVYSRRRVRKDKGYSGNIMELTSDHVGLAGPISLLASIADVESAVEELYISVIPKVLTNFTIRLTSTIWDRHSSMLGSDNFFFFRSLFPFNCQLIQLLPLVRLEVAFIDNLGPKFFLFEGCLSWAVAILCQTFGENYCWKNLQRSSVENIPLKKITINISNLNNNCWRLHFTLDGFLQRNSRWRYLENNLNQLCIRFKDLCPTDHVKSLSDAQPLKETIPIEDSQKKKDEPNYDRFDESDQVSDITLENFGSSNIIATDSKLSAFAHLRIETDALCLSNDEGCLKSSRDCLSIEVNGVPCSIGCSDLGKCIKTNGGACSVGCSVVGKNSRVEMLVQHQALSEHPRCYKGPENLSFMFRDDPSSPDKSEGGCVSSSKTTEIEVLRATRAGLQTMYKGSRDARMESNLLWEMNEHAIHSPKALAPSVWHHNQHTLVSPILDSRSSLWSEDFIQSGFVSSTKKPRSQVSYAALSRGHDIRLKNRTHHRKGSLYKKLRTDSPRKQTIGLEGHRNFQESLTCHANVLITTGDRGWRELGAEVILDSDDQKDWKIVVKVSGATKFTYKAHQILQPGIPNRYTHAMMWKGGKDWSLEFSDRNQWLLFKMMHGHCFNQNLRAASVKNIPIPGVQLIEDHDERFTEVPFVRTSKYYELVGTEVDMALDPCHVLYDMDSDDEKWVLKFPDSLDSNDTVTFEVTDEMFERVMDMFERVAYINQCDCFNDDEISEYMGDFGSFDIIKSMHEYWHEKRRKNGMPLVRQYQPPLWERYHQQLKEWELNTLKVHCQANECQEKVTATEKSIEKPPMFAFCLKPRGLEANKGSKQRSHKKLMYSGNHSSFSREQDGGFLSSGRRFNVSSIGDEKSLIAIHSFEGSHSTRWLQSPSSFSPKLFRNFSKRNGEHLTPWDPSVVSSSYGERPKRNGLYTLECPISKQFQPDGVQRQQPDISEFRLRDVSSAAQHASNMAKLKREKAQWLMHKADLALHKAVIAIMTADAIKTSQIDLIDDQ